MMIRTFLIGSTKQMLLAIFYSALGITIATIVAVVWLLNDRQDLSIWHTTKLKNEYHQQSGLKNFTEYLALEEKLFDEVDKKVYQKYQPKVASPINRYEQGSSSDPSLWEQNWNRSFDWPNPDAEFGVLLLHGMSDSPYSLSHIAEHYQHQAHVVGLRLPGHGTIPAGLNDIIWPDLASSVTLATQHLRASIGNKPLYVIGFSTGAALALNLELEAIALGKKPSFDKLIFMSPAIGLTPIAQGAYWQAMLGELLGQDKLFWNSIEAEYDPFKYMSFAVNAGDVVYQLSLRNKALIKQLDANQLAQLPPILTFQSVIDDTVSTQAVVADLYQYLPKDHELVIFDYNRSAKHQLIMNADPLNRLLPYWGLETVQLDAENQQAITPFQYRLTLIENDPTRIGYVQARDMISDQADRVMALDIFWPKGLFSMSHISLPFPVEDHLYGPIENTEDGRVQIGLAILQSERGLVSMSPANMLRPKWNPFYPYMLGRMDSFISP